MWDLLFSNLLLIIMQDGRNIEDRITCCECRSNPQFMFLLELYAFCNLTFLAPLRIFVNEILEYHVFYSRCISTQNQLSM